MGSRFLDAVQKVTDALVAGRMLKAYNVVDHEDTSVGPYTDIVDRGYRFVVTGWRNRREQVETRTAKEAAISFINRVGDSRALVASNPW